MDSTKKISFGFNKLNKKPNILINKEPVKEENSKVQLIEYLEEQSIKVIGDENNVPAGPLVIPMKAPNKKLINLVDIVKNDFKDTVEESQEKTVDNAETNKDDTSLTLDEMAAKELMNDMTSNNTNNDVTKVIEVPATEKVTFEGEKESSLDDYESIPVEQFGKAMLRGMGWKDGQGIGKNQQLVKVAQPVIRPKGMGLGADSMTKKAADTPAAVDRNGKVLTCVKGAYIKVIAGYHKGNYGQIMGFDDESGRFIIKLTLTNINVSLNEFLVTPVTKEEYNKNSKVLNNAKYEEYLKNKDLKANQNQIKREPQNSDEEKYNKVTVKKEPTSESSDETTSRKKTKQRIKKEKGSDEDTRKVKREQRSRSHDEYSKKYREKDSKYKSKENSKNERKNKSDYSRKKYSDSDSEIDVNKKNDKYEGWSKKSSKKEKYEDSKSSKDKYEDSKSTKDKYEASTKSSKDKYEDTKSTKDKYEVETRKSRKSNKKDKYKDETDSEYENQPQSRSYEKRNSSKKRYSDSESEDRVKKSTKAKKQQYSSEDDSEKYERKSRRHERESDSDERYERKSHKKDKYRDRSRHSGKDRRR